MRSFIYEQYSADAVLSRNSIGIKGGILVEHWDGIQDEATREQSKSEKPMFGDAFPVYA
jgi:predicted SnoaL-like aldol condensation-catalyzing enzyme